MKRRGFLIALLVGCCALAGSMQAILYGISGWRGNNQNIICFSSCHVDNSWVLGTKQSEQLIAAAKQLNATVLVEDSDHYDGTNKQAQELIKSCSKSDLSTICDASDHLVTNDAFLGDLIGQCKVAKIDCSNAECRHLAFFSASDYNNGNNISLEAVIKDYYTTVQSLEKELAAIKQEIYTSSFAQTIYEEYQQRIKTFNNNLDAFIKKYGHSSFTVRQLIDQGYNTLKTHVLYQLGDILVDCMILLQLWKHRDKKNIFICAGGDHIKTLERLFMKKQQYTRTHCTYSLPGPEIDALSDNQLRKSIKSNPVDISKFIKVFTELPQSGKITKTRHSAHHHMPSPYAREQDKKSSQESHYAHPLQASPQELEELIAQNKDEYERYWAFRKMLHLHSPASEETDFFALQEKNKKTAQEQLQIESLNDDPDYQPMLEEKIPGLGQLAQEGTTSFFLSAMNQKQSDSMSPSNLDT